MEIQTKYRTDPISKDMVLYFHFSRGPETRARPYFMAEIYEASKISELGSTNKIFYCSGTRLTEWATALAFLDFLLEAKGVNLSPDRRKMDGWLSSFEAISRECPLTHKVHIKIYNEKPAPHLRITKDRITTSTRGNGVRLTPVVLSSVEGFLQDTFLNHQH